MPVRCSVYFATSLDGFIARRDGGIDWLSVVEQPGEDYGFAEFLASVDALVLGRKTYDTVLGFGEWPYSGKRCVVMTRGSLSPRHGEERFSGAPTELVARLEGDGVRRVYVDGGEVIRQFLAADLIDDLTLSVVPMTLGEGIRPFSDDAPRDARWQLTRSRAFASGLVQSEYRARR